MLIKSSLIFILTILIIWIGGFVAFFCNVLTVKPAPISIKSDAIIVFTGGFGRVEAGADLIRGGASEKLFISGVNSNVDIVDIIGEDGMDIANNIEIGKGATTTRQNGIEVGAWVDRQPCDISSIRLVTSNYHITRATMELKANVPKNTVIIQHPVVDARFSKINIPFVKLIWSEYHKWLLRMLQIKLMHIF